MPSNYSSLLTIKAVHRVEPDPGFHHSLPSTLTTFKDNLIFLLGFGWKQTFIVWVYSLLGVWHAGCVVYGSRRYSMSRPWLIFNVRVA
jgi:hypothetical protein